MTNRRDPEGRITATEILNRRNSVEEWRTLLSGPVDNAFLQTFHELRRRLFARLYGNPSPTERIVLQSGRRITLVDLDPDFDIDPAIQIAGPNPHESVPGGGVQALFAEFSRENPPPWIRIRELIEIGLSPVGAAELLTAFGLDPNDMIEASSPLLPEIEDENDAMGAGTDPGVSMGEAESWFRDQARGDGG